VVLLDALRTAGADQLREGLRSEAVRRVHGHRRRAADAVVPDLTASVERKE
jgi:hypothetical protein